MRKSALAALVTFACAALPACGEVGRFPDDSKTCTDGPLLARARVASLVPPGLDDERDERASYVRPTRCTEALSEAREWTAAVNEGVNRPGRDPKLRGERTSDRFFEFGTSDEIVWRVHRCSYLTNFRTDGFDPADEVSLATLKVRPLTSDVARRAAPYVFHVLDTERGHVLSATPSADGFDLDLEIATITGGDFPDEVTVRHVVIRIDPATGETRRTRGPVTAVEQATCE